MKKRTKIYVFFTIFVFVSVALTVYFFRLRQAGDKKTNTLSAINKCPDCNLVLITLTNVRYDHVSSNGYSRKTTPNIDDLAKESIVFDNAFSHASWTLPESMSIYTSLYPYQHGVMNRYDGSVLSSSTPTLIDILKKFGYTTAAFTGGFDYNPAFGLTNRFDHYEECSKGETADYPRQNGPVSGGPSDYGELSCTAPLAVEWLKKNVSKKFFMHVQGFDAHCPFAQNDGKMFDPKYDGEVDFSTCLWTMGKTEPEEKDGEMKYKTHNMKVTGEEVVWLGQNDIKHLVANYDESIYGADSEVGKVVAELKNLNILDKTIVVITSEHGDIFGKYGKFMRGGASRGTFYDDVLHIPLLIKVPGIVGARVKGLVSQIDLMPTLLEILKLPAPNKIEGKSVVSMIENGTPVNDYFYAGTKFSPGVFNPYYNGITKVEVIRNLDWKLMREITYQPISTKGLQSTGVLLKDVIRDENLKIERVENELFRLSKDPDELKNLVGRESEKLKELTNLLDTWAKRLNENK